MIGGATTSTKHTAVKIAPGYHESVVHVKDASRCVGIVDKLTRPEARVDFDRDNRVAQERERENFARRRQRKLVPYDEAVRRRFRIDWQASPIARPDFLGTTVLRDYPLAEIVPYIDWSPFFMAWELSGKYPQILTDPKVGAEATKLFNDAQDLLERIKGRGGVTPPLLRAEAVYGFFPAASDGDDVVVYTDDE